MKANEAPEKIYVDANEDWHRTYTAFTEKAKGDDIEYTRTDAFIEKVYNWLKNYAFVDDNKNVNLPTLLHDFLKDSRKF